MFITPEEFNRPGKEVENALLNFVGNAPLHISFDVDSIDTKYIPSTGTPVKGGIQLEKAKKVLDLLDKRANIVNMDVTEWNPHLGTRKQRQKSEVNTTYLFSRFLRK